MESKQRYEEYVLAQGGLRIAHKKLSESRERLIAAQNELKDAPTLIEDGKQAISPYMDELKECMSLAREIDANTSAAFKEMVLKVFKTVFTNMRSRTEDLIEIKTKYRSGKLTMGKIGFGIKHNVQTSGIERFDEVAAIFENLDKVVQAMAEYQGMKKWIDKLKQMAEILPDANSLERGDVLVELEEKVLVPHDRLDGDYHKYSVPLRADRVAVVSQGLRLYGEETEDGETYRSEHMLYLNTDRSSNGEWLDAVCYIQLESSMRTVIDEYKADAIPTLERIKAVKTELKQAFGAELLLAGL